MTDEEKRFYEKEAERSYQQHLASNLYLDAPRQTALDFFVAGFLAGIEFSTDLSRTHVLGTVKDDKR